MLKSTYKMKNEPNLFLHSLFFLVKNIDSDCKPLGETCVEHEECCDGKACSGPIGQRKCTEWFF